MGQGVDADDGRADSDDERADADGVFTKGFCRHGHP